MKHRLGFIDNCCNFPHCMRILLYSSSIAFVVVFKRNRFLQHGDTFRRIMDTINIYGKYLRARNDIGAIESHERNARTECEEKGTLC